jgi:prepilin-type N-terminal cleavage/methylation domain-containing protein
MISKFSVYKCLTSHAGFSLIEVLVAIGIFSVAILGLAVGAITITRANKTSQFHTVATNVAQDMMEQLKAKPMAGLSSGNDAFSYQGVPFTRAWTVAPNPPVAGNNTITITVNWTDYSLHTMTVSSRFFY